MAVKWKTKTRFKPEFVLEKINAARTVSPEGGASYSGFDLQENLPILQSMLDFPRAAADVDASTLVWSALGKVPEELTPSNVLVAINRELSDRLSTREQRYLLVTTISLDTSNLPQKVQHASLDLRFLNGLRSPYLVAHKEVISKHRIPIEPTPSNYQWLIAQVRAKSAAAAFKKAMDMIDLQRSLWCLMGNTQMSISFGTPSFSPINAIRLGGHHTLHNPGGGSARDGLWYEPNFTSTKPHHFDNPTVVWKNSKWALHRIESCHYGYRIAGALVRFVRALDQADPDSAFVRLWGALEALVTPDIADYDALVRRCTFLFQDGPYHRQVLEHLREYRNSHLHGGVESNHARTHCFQLQMYFVQAVWFFISHTDVFSSIEEVNRFLDHPADLKVLKRQLSHTKRAIRFVTPK